MESILLNIDTVQLDLAKGGRVAMGYIGEPTFIQYCNEHVVGQHFKTKRVFFRVFASLEAQTKSGENDDSTAWNQYYSN